MLSTTDPTSRGGKPATNSLSYVWPCPYSALEQVVHTEPLRFKGLMLITVKYTVGIHVLVHFTAFEII
jgi:hypothetical protein